MHWHGNRGKNTRLFKLTCFTKVFHVNAFGFVGCILFSRCNMRTLASACMLCLSGSSKPWKQNLLPPLCLVRSTTPPLCLVRSTTETIHRTSNLHCMITASRLQFWSKSTFLIIFAYRTLHKLYTQHYNKCAKRSRWNLNDLRLKHS